MPDPAKGLQSGAALPMEPPMHCDTCKGAVRFVDGSWQHVAATKCAAVVVAWPATPGAIADDAA